MEKHYQLSITSDTTDINVNSTDADEVARIVQLAGINATPTPLHGMQSDAQPPVMPAPQEPAGASPPSGPDITDALDTEIATDMELGKLDHVGPDMDESHMSCSICGSSDHDESSCPSMQEDDLNIIGEDVAEYDYGENEFDDDGHEIDVEDFVHQGSKLPQRIVKGGQGDNPLISELHSKYVDQYKEYLAEDERENAEGVMSPLSDATKPEFDKDPMSDMDPVDDGSRSPLSTIKRQHAFK